MNRSSLKRKALTNTNLTYLRWRYYSNAKRTLKALQSRDAHAEHVKQVADELAEKGIVVGPAPSYLSEEGRKTLGEASASVLKISQSPEVQATLANGLEAEGKDYLVRVVPWDMQHAPDSPLIKLAVDKKLLEIVAAYLGMWPRLHAVGAWLNFPTEADAKEAQLWHRDPEDLKIIKVFIYLNDVGPDNGPFCYIPKTHPFSSGSGIVPNHKDKKRILDDEMISVLPKESWIACTGPANTMIIADTVGYHRGGKPTNGTRVLITFTYTSGKPLSKRVLRVPQHPAWITHPIQGYAL
jgi:hypothetical protein